MTVDKLVNNPEYKLHHTSYTRRYISRKLDGIIAPYKGRFGEGYTLLKPNWGSTRYSYICYYVLNDKG